MQSPYWRHEGPGRHLDLKALQVSKHARSSYIPLLSIGTAVHNSKVSRPDVHFCTSVPMLISNYKRRILVSLLQEQLNGLPLLQPSSSRSPRLHFRTPSLPILIIDPITCALCFSQRCHRCHHRCHHQLLVQARVYPSLRSSSPRGNRPSTSLSH